MRKDEGQNRCNGSRLTLAKETSSSFGVIIDKRELAPIKSDAQDLMVQGQERYKAKGMNRSAVLVNNNVTAMQFKRLAQESGIDKWERYIAATTPDCANISVSWVQDEIDPG